MRLKIRKGIRGKLEGMEKKGKGREERNMKKKRTCGKVKEGREGETERRGKRKRGGEKRVETKDNVQKIMVTRRKLSGKGSKGEKEG